MKHLPESGWEKLVEFNFERMPIKIHYVGYLAPSFESNLKFLAIPVEFSAKFNQSEPIKCNVLF